MIKSTYLVLAITIIVCGCNKLDIEKDTPGCVKREIRKFARDVDCDDASASEYLFQGKTVYVLEPGSCGADIPSPVIDSDCNEMGKLNGISGNTIINCEEFKNAEFKKVVWGD